MVVISLIVLAVVPLAILSLGFLFFNPAWPHHEERRQAVKLLAIAAFLVGLFFIIVAHRYKVMTQKYEELCVTDYEPYYFALQTISTVGYGSALCVPPCCDPNSPLPPGDLVKLRGDFHRLASWSMLMILQWLLILNALVGMLGGRFSQSLQSRLPTNQNA